MQEKVVSSSNGYYVFECADTTGGSCYEIRMGTRCVKRVGSLDEAKRFIQFAYAEEENYQD
ncbi:hypothetical protein EAW52_12855 [Pseudomonas sp. LTJR-52]|uniref:hypothetical protein n=1 Tax=Pseudomonas sp. LTJR-52 TaxID=2479392 RepID=UPI000EFC7B13|nr:hypothetical protein [Pseudomonas sp. LTJR-52]AYN94777.1 hypothetical protein EAW52_12855 [Pseudomonas sp. LTJR-52]